MSQIKLPPLLMIGVALFSASLCRPKPKPKGPEAIARQDPTRIVATIGRRNVTANQAWNVLKLITPQVRREHQAKLADLLQQLYLEREVADEATRLHLDRQSPWKERLQGAHAIIPNAGNYPGDRNTPPAIAAQWNNARQKILWNAYFSQAHTVEERQALLQRQQDKCKIQVQDPDFFNGGNF